MIGLRLGLAAVLVVAGTSALAAAHTEWVGTWGYVIAPLPPGAPQAPAAAGPPPAAAPAPLVAIPLIAPPAAAPPPPAAAPPPAFQVLIENPGSVPLGAAPANLTNVTVRQIVRISAGGKRLRLRLSNEGGADALPFGAVHVGKAGPDGQILPGTDRVVTFAGRPGMTAPASSPILSDPIDLATQDLDRLAVSIYLPQPVSSRQPRALYDYVAGAAGDHTGDAQLPQASLMRVPAFVTLVEVEPTAPTNVVVALGDSITEGATSTNNAFRSWPDRLAERIAANHWAVVNTGISGNRLLRYGAGPSALARLDRDVLSVPGVKTIILLEGINDIGIGFGRPNSAEPVTLEALEAADLQIIARAHEHGIRVIGATLTPYGGATYAAPAGEQARQGLNQWIKTGGAFDGVIDFAAAVADAKDPLTINPAYNIRDHLHPNDAGYKAMGDAIDLKLVMGGK